MKALQLPDDALLGRRMYGIHEDFLEFVSGDTMTSLAADAGSSVAVNDGAGGIATLTTGATDNNETAVKTTKELFLFADDKPLAFGAKVKHTEAATDDANVIIGVLDVFGANTLIDNGAGPIASFSGAAFYKVDGALNWHVIVSIGATRTDRELTAAISLDKQAHTIDSGVFHTFDIEFLPKNSTQSDVVFRIDNITVAKVTDFVFTSATEMMAGVGNKAGGAASEVTLVDWIACHQLH